MGKSRTGSLRQADEAAIESAGDACRTGGEGQRGGVAWIEVLRCASEVARTKRRGKWSAEELASEVVVRFLLAVDKGVLAEYPRLRADSNSSRIAEPVVVHEDWSTAAPDLKAYLRRIASLVAMEWSRRERVARTAVGKLAVGARIPEADERFASLGSGCEGDEILRLVADRAGESWVLVRMRSLGATHREIASALGRSEASVRQQWRRLQAELKRRASAVRDGLLES